MKTVDILYRRYLVFWQFDNLKWIRHWCVACSWVREGGLIIRDVECWDGGVLTLSYIWTLTGLGWAAIVRLPKFLTFVFRSCDSLGFVKFRVDLYFVVNKNVGISNLLCSQSSLVKCTTSVHTWYILGKWKLVCQTASPAQAMVSVINFRSRSRCQDGDWWPGGYKERKVSPDWRPTPASDISTW